MLESAILKGYFCISSLFNLIVQPFWHYLFLKRALLGCAALSIGCGAVGSFLVLRRMSLVADALSHGLFPGVAIAFLLAGFTMTALTVGGAITAVLLGLLAQYMVHQKKSTQDGAFAILVFFSTGLSLFILAQCGGYTDVMHILLGNILALSRDNLFWLGGVSSFTLITLALFYRPFVLHALDPYFFKSTYRRNSLIDTLFLLLVAINTVCALQALGSLLALGLLIIPALTAQRLTQSVSSLCLMSTALAFLSSFLGLLYSYYMGYPSGPLIILVAIFFYGLSLIPKKNTRKLFFLSSLLASIPLLFYLKAPEKKSQVVVSFTVLEDFVKVLSGDRLKVVSLVGPNRDPHTFEPSPQEMRKIKEADLVIMNGLGLEKHWLPRFLKQYKQKVIIASQDVTPHFIKTGRQKIPDPHAWHDIKSTQCYVRTIAHALIHKWPAYKHTIQKRLENYLIKLENLAHWIQKKVSAIPAEKRLAITTHDGFAYFERAYGIRFLTPLGASTENEPSPEKIAQLINTAKQKNIRAIFFENMVSKKIIEILAENTGLKVGGTLYSDALSEKNGPASSYLLMMRHNTRTICDQL